MPGSLDTHDVYHVYITGYTHSYILSIYNKVKCIQVQVGGWGGVFGGLDI